MMCLSRATLTLTLLALGAPAAEAHYSMLLPQPTSVKRGQETTLLYQWGHPFEHQLFDAPAPEELSVIYPGGAQENLTERLEKITIPAADGKKVTAYRLRFAPKDRGDYVFQLRTGLIWMAEEKVFFKDLVRVVLHVQDQEGWDASDRTNFRIVPLTRPYGLRPGMVFQAQVLNGSLSQAGVLVEIEHYNPSPPKELPPDEHITRTAKTAPHGVVTCTFTEAGWWCLTAQVTSGKKQERDGKSYPVRRRTTMWVFVDAAAAGGR
jgi:cobalt/nickel transport protein